MKNPHFFGSGGADCWAKEMRFFMLMELFRRPYGFLLMAAALAAMLCLFPVQAGEPQEGTAIAAGEAETMQEGMPVGADLSQRTGERCALHKTTCYAPCGHSVQQRMTLPAQLRGLTRTALEEALPGVLAGAQVTGFSADEVDVSVSMEIPCPLHWVLVGGEEGMLCILQNRTGETLSVVRESDIPFSLVPKEDRDALAEGRIFDDVQVLEGYLESLSS